jgi:hypothetical protein
MTHPLSLVPPSPLPGYVVPYGRPFTPNVSEVPGSAQRLDELRDLLAAFCLLEAQKFYETAKNTPANVASLRELARVAQVVLAIDPKSGESGADDRSSPFDFSILSNDELERFRELRDKARGGGRAA